ncbi:lytic transglycosylase domain-containing protein [Burkholderia sp. Bp9126]|nr:lytic transglycosylase domain-containing protein [Burkholderia sp. Bp9126]
MKYGTLIASVAGEFDLDTNLLHALVQVESGYNANAVSSRGAIGLMQVIPATGARFGFFDLFDPQTNLRAGATYLAWLMSEFDNDLPLALAAYNAGEGSVHKSHDQIPPNRETRTYVRQVIEIYRKKQRTSSSQRSLSPKEVGSVRSTKSSQALRISAGKLLVKLGVLLLYGPNASKH